jgi:hypothetical protein
MSTDGWKTDQNPRKNQWVEAVSLVVRFSRLFLGNLRGEHGVQKSSFVTTFSRKPTEGMERKVIETPSKS